MSFTASPSYKSIKSILNWAKSEIGVFLNNYFLICAKIFQRHRWEFFINSISSVRSHLQTLAGGSDGVVDPEGHLSSVHRIEYGSIWKTCFLQVHFSFLHFYLTINITRFNEGLYKPNLRGITMKFLKNTSFR